MQGTALLAPSVHTQQMWNLFGYAKIIIARDDEDSLSSPYLIEAAFNFIAVF
jgi:hypothetical protein